MKSWIRVCGVLGLLLIVTVVVVQAQPAPVDEFVPLSPDQIQAEQDQIPAARLVFAAYGIVWLVFALYLLSLWRRVTQVESELHAVATKLGQSAR
jgi:CcmD family protein